MINGCVPSLEDEGLDLAGLVHGRPSCYCLSVVFCDRHDPALSVCVWTGQNEILGHLVLS